jgi:peptide/nickel transport system ATP-binding protein/oligopeptide transport system ATP-binding protein
MSKRIIDTRKPLLSVDLVKKYYPITKGSFSKKPDEFVKAVDGVSFKIFEGEMLGLVGESGCGKSTMARLIIRLEDVTDGRIWFDGQDITSLKGMEMQEARKNFQIVFQDPYSSLNPRQRVGDILGEALYVHGMRNKKERGKRIEELLDLVGMPANAARRYPHEFSGGQRQRIGIARALSVNPRLLICDEPVSALDVSIQAQVLNLLKDLQKELNLTVLFIAHGLGAVKYISDRIIVMNKGKIVEEGKTEQIFFNPQDPYTQQLLDAYPIPDPLKRKRRNTTVLTGC